jgi:secreted trypsin-like serine protease
MGDVTIRSDEANARSAARHPGAVALVAALVMLASLVVMAGATASSRAAGNPKATASVIGGHNTTIAEYPSLAFIEGLQATDGYACTGTVVAPRVILTAGHCVEDLESSSIVQPGLVAVATGVSNIKNVPETQVTQVTQALVYPGFNPSELHGDAGLLILASPVTAPPIALAGKADPSLYNAGRVVKIAGWGLTERGAEELPNQLQAATVPIDKAENCRRGTRLYDPFYDPDSQLCTLDPNRQAIFCHGDSGGPAITNSAEGTAVEVGIISLNDGACNPASPAVYTRVDQISTWVQRWIKAVEAGGTKPRIVVPRSHLPTLTRERAEELSILTLEEAFGETLLHGKELTIGCRRQGKARAKCVVTWYKGADDYFGRVNVFFSIRQNIVLAGSHYLVKWVNDHCYFDGPDPKGCKVHSKSR